MKVVSRVFLAIVLLAAGGGGFWYFAGKREEARWQHLPDGAEIRVAQVTVGVRHDLEHRSTFGENVRRAIRARSWKPIREGTGVVRTTSIAGSSPTIAVWLDLRRPVRPPGTVVVERVPADACLVLGDGRKIRSHGGSGSTGPDGAYFSANTFSYIPYREKTLRYQGKLGVTDLEFTVENPAYRTDPPVWDGKPLPQTIESEGIALTLRGIEFEPNPESMRKYSGDWRTQLKYAVTKGGEKADRWYSLTALYGDPSDQFVRDCGLFTEPVWLVQCLVARTDLYPYPEEEVQWLGTLGTAAPEPQKYELLPAAASTSESPMLIGAFGEGQYWIKDGVVVEVQPLGPTPPLRHARITQESQAKRTRVIMTQPGVIIVGSASLVLRDPQGAPTQLANEWSHGGITVTRLCPLPKKPIRVGTVDPGSWTFDFYVNAPPKPEK